MKPTNYSHEAQFSGERLDMYIRLQLINTATDGAHNATLSEYPDLAQPAIQAQRAAGTGTNPGRQAVASQPRSEQVAAGSEVPAAIVVPAVEQPRTAAAGPVAVARTEKDQHEADRQQRIAAALAYANREAQ